MLSFGFHFDSVQMPLNPFDAGFHTSFERQVLPELAKQGIAPLGMKSMSGHGDAVKKGVLSARESLTYAMSLPVATIIAGMDSFEVLRQNVAIARGFQALPATEMQSIRDKARAQAGDARFELYKVSLKFDNPEARQAHHFPLDDQQMEVKEELAAVKSTGKPK
jgi:hypothetical protein